MSNDVFEGLNAVALLAVNFALRKSMSTSILLQWPAAKVTEELRKIKDHINLSFQGALSIDPLHLNGHGFI